MNIGYEAKRVYQNRTGLGNAARSIVHSMDANYPNHQYHLFAPRITNLFSIDGNANMHAHAPNFWLGNQIKAWWRSKGVVKQLTQNEIDVYIGLGAELPLGLASKKIKSIVMIYDLIYERYPKQYNPIDVYTYRKKAKYACGTADAIITISQQTKQDLIDFYEVPAEKITVVYLSCNEQFYQQHSPTEIATIQHKYNLPGAYFLSVGSIIERKGLSKICEAIHLLKKNTIPLVVIGNGKNDYADSIAAFITKYNLQDKIIFLNQKPEAQNENYKNSIDFPAIYQGATALIYPSVFEGFGLPVLEGMASGLPVITSNCSCMPEVGGDAVLYVNPLDAQKIADAMQHVSTDQHLCNALITKGRMQAQLFSEQHLAKRIMHVVDEVCK